MIYCRVKLQVTKKRFYKYYVFFFPHLIKRKATLMLIWGSALTKFKIENNWGKLFPAYSACLLEVFLWRIYCSCFYRLEYILVHSQSSFTFSVFSYFKGIINPCSLRCLNRVAFTGKAHSSSRFWPSTCFRAVPLFTFFWSDSFS